MQSSFGIFVTFASAIVFGLYPPAARGFYENGGNASALMLATSLFRFLFLYLYCRFRSFDFFPKSKEISSILSAGIYQSISNISLLASFLFLPGPISMTILFTHTSMLLIILCVKGERKLTPIVLFSTLSAFIGISMVVGLWGSEFEINYLGVLLAFSAAIFTVIRLYMFEKEVAKNDPIVVGARVFFIVSLSSILYCIFHRPIFHFSLLSNLWLLLASASLTIGTFGMFFAIKMIGSFKFSLFIKIEPIFTALFSFLLLKEVLLPLQYLGMLLVILSLTFYQYFEGRKEVQ
jgi:drug/metabolite transporter (DMT)-like permease